MNNRQKKLEFKILKYFLFSQMGKPVFLRFSSFLALKKYNPPCRRLQKRVHIFFAWFKGQHFQSPCDKLKTTWKCEILELGTYNNLAQHRKCQKFFSKNTPPYRLFLIDAWACSGYDLVKSCLQWSRTIMLTLYFVWNNIPVRQFWRLVENSKCFTFHSSFL